MGMKQLYLPGFEPEIVNTPEMRRRLAEALTARLAFLFSPAPKLWVTINLTP